MVWRRPGWWRSSLSSPGLASHVWSSRLVEVREEHGGGNVGVQTLLVGLCGVEIGAVEVEMVEESLPLLESCRADQTLELLDWRREKVRGRISARVEPGHHVGQWWRRHSQEPGVGEVEIEAKVGVLELLRGRSSRLVFLAVAGVEEIKESRAVRSELLPGLTDAPPPTSHHFSFLGGLFPYRMTFLKHQN